jgi:hypothetical protein
MTVTKAGREILIQLSPEESEAVDYFIHKNGKEILDEYFGHFIKTRIDTKKADEGNDLFRLATAEERQRILGRLP